MDEDGALNYDEFKAVWTGFAAVHSQLNLNLYDKNHNYMLDPEELAVWKTEGKLANFTDPICRERAKSTRAQP